jgi:hypothetical protein
MEEPYLTDLQSGKTMTDSQGNPVRRSTRGESFLMPDGSIYERNSYAPLSEEMDEIRTPGLPGRRGGHGHHPGGGCQKTLDEAIGSACIWGEK